MLTGRAVRPHSNDVPEYGCLPESRFAETRFAEIRVRVRVGVSANLD